MRNRRFAALAAAVAAGVLGWYAWSSAAAPEAAAVASAGAALPANSPFTSLSASASAFGDANRRARAEQLALWQQRLARAQDTLEAYRDSTRYPYESQPSSAHPDQLYPNRPIDEDHALRTRDGKAASGVRLRTSQERVFVQGMESVRFSVSLVDDQGRTQPLRVNRAWARELPKANAASLFPEVPLNFNDDGTGGDAAPNDGVYSATLQPATQGFAQLLGAIRVEVDLQYRDQRGMTFFDIVYTPQSPADWQGGVREALEDGSLNFYLGANVRVPGRYVVTARVDDASGKPFALLTFNDEMTAGAQAFRLSLFGKLVRDGRPSFPLTLRDVDAFLLRPDAFPDRLLMPRLTGTVHVSRSYPLTGFADGEWSSEERSRYLAELQRDVDAARTRVDQLGRP